MQDPVFNTILRITPPGIIPFGRTGRPNTTVSHGLLFALQARWLILQEMHKIAGSFLSSALALLVLTLATLYSFWHRAWFNFQPDRDYHLFISKKVLQEGVPRTIDQLPLLGWHEYFADKEFLYHILTAVAYKLNQAAGLDQLSVLLTVLAAYLVYLCARLFCEHLPALLLVLATVSLNLLFYERMLLVRPHVLAVPLFLLIVYSLLLEKRWWAFAAALFFSLGYHAIYVPAVVLLICAGIFFVFDKKRNIKPAGYALIGLLIGAVVNPYFPANIMLAVQHLAIATSLSQKSRLDFGAELMTMPFGDFVLYYWPQALIFLVALLLIVFLAVRKNLTMAWLGENRALVLLTISFLTFMFVGLYSHRIMEYAVPLSAIVLAGFYGLIAGQLQAVRRWGSIGLAVLVLLAIVQIHPIKAKDNEIDDLITTAIDAIPPGESGGQKLVFHCSWASGSYIINRRPDLQAIDILDPTFLLLASPKHYFARRQFLRDDITANQSHEIIADVYGADYVLCTKANVLRRLVKDPRYKLVFPIKYTKEPGLFFVFQRIQP